MCCCYVIITSRTLLWTLLSIATTLSMLAAVITPSWLIGPPRMPGMKNKGRPESEAVTNNIIINAPEDYVPTLGIYNRCTKVHQIDAFYVDSCAPFATGLGQSSDLFPTFWKASLVFFALGLLVMTLSIAMALAGCCCRSCCRKSIFTISGTVQAVAGLFFLLGLIMYPAGWGSRRVEAVCGKTADPFWLGSCEIGWALYLAVGTTVATFACAILSVQADVSTSTDKVQDEILEGKKFICLL